MVGELHAIPLSMHKKIADRTRLVRGELSRNSSMEA